MANGYYWPTTTLLYLGVCVCVFGGGGGGSRDVILNKPLQFIVDQVKQSEASSILKRNCTLYTVYYDTFCVSTSVCHCPILYVLDTGACSSYPGHKEDLEDCDHEAQEEGHHCAQHNVLCSIA